MNWLAKFYAVGAILQCDWPHPIVFYGDMVWLVGNGAHTAKACND